MSLAIPTRPSDEEMELVDQVRLRLQDLELNDKYMEAKNLVRFIRARGTVDQAELMIRNNIVWMEEMKIEGIRERTPPSLFQDIIPWGVCSLDEFGGPVVVIRAGEWEPSSMSGLKDQLVRFFLFIVESWHHAIYSKEREYLPQFSVIVDLKGLSWKHYFCYDAIQAALIVLRYFEANYPDILRFAAILNCPSVFGMFWKMVKPIVSPVTHAKLCFLYTENKDECRQTLSQYLPANKFPQQYGGTIPDSLKIWTPSDLNKVDENENDKIPVKENSVLK